MDKYINEDLRKWFDPKHPEGGWKRINTKGEVVGPCAREPGEPKPKCMSNRKRAQLSQGERAAAVRTKRKHDPDPERKGEPIMVSNFGKGRISEEFELDPKDNLIESLEVLLEKNKPTSPDKWADCISQAKAKFDVYPSAYANGWASQCYKRKGGKWKSVNESTKSFSSFIDRSEILSEMSGANEMFSLINGRTNKIIVEKYIVQDNLKNGIDGKDIRSFAKKFGGSAKSNKETTEFMFDDHGAADSFVKAITGKGLNEATECDGRQSGKPWRTPGEKKKFAVCVDGKIVRFGDPGLSIKRDQPGRLKNFRARHGCDKGGIARDTPKYWSCQMWRKDKSVTDLTKGS
jgi:hypothetical protein